MNTLKDNEILATKKIKIKEFYISGYSLQEIGDKVGLTRERVRQVLHAMCGEDFEYIPRQQEIIVAKRMVRMFAPLITDYIIARRIKSRRYLKKVGKKFFSGIGDRNATLLKELINEKEIYWKATKLDILDRYKELTLQLGYAPNATYLQKYGRGLYNSILKYYGGFLPFVKEWQQLGYMVRFNEHKPYCQPTTSQHNVEQMKLSKIEKEIDHEFPMIDEANRLYKGQRVIDIRDKVK